jgi:hypothetical protein
MKRRKTSRSFLVLELDEEVAHAVLKGGRGRVYGRTL